MQHTAGYVPDSDEDFMYKALNAVTLTNDYIAEEHGEESMFATLFFGVLDPLSGKMAYVNAGHEPLLVVNQTGVKKSLKATGTVVGMLPAMEYQVNQVEIEPGDVLIGFTDGVTEAMSPQQKLFGKERLLSLFENLPSTASELIDRINSELFNHIDNAPQFDDITMIAVRREKKNRRTAEY
jgi:sigma-B regulation protein RsbU (phosphoserine phosphatase)